MQTQLHILRIAFATLALCTLSCRSTLESQINISPEAGYQQLLVVKSFAFGGVGTSDEISKGEFAYQAVLRSPKALELFHAALFDGTPEAQLYALCGIRHLDRKAFSKEAQPLSDVNPKVSTMKGRIVSQRNAVDVIADIAAGKYDWSIGKLQWRKARVVQ